MEAALPKRPPTTVAAPTFTTLFKTPEKPPPPFVKVAAAPIPANAPAVPNNLDCPAESAEDLFCSVANSTSSKSNFFLSSNPPRKEKLLLPVPLASLFAAVELWRTII